MSRLLTVVSIFVLCIFAALGPAGAVEEGADASRPAGPFSVAVLRYWSRIPDKGSFVAPGVERGMEAALATSNRFHPLERGAAHDVMDQMNLPRRGAVDDTQAADFGQTAGVDCVIYGSVTRADCDVSSSKSVKSGKPVIRYSMTANVTVQHNILNIHTRQVWIAATISATRQINDVEDQPTEQAQERACADAARDTIRNFVRQLVPSAQGKVLAKTADTVVLDLGSKSGMGDDVDVQFFRMVPILDDKGAPVLNDEGKPRTLRQAVSALMRPGHKKPTPCCGHPKAGTVDADQCECAVGYYTGGVNPGFTPTQPAFDAVQVGDVVELAARQ